MFKRIFQITVISLFLSMFVSAEANAATVEGPGGTEITIADNAVVVISQNDCSNIAKIEEAGLDLKKIQNEMKDSNILYDAIYGDYEVIAYAYKIDGEVKRTSVGDTDLQDYKEEFQKQIGEQYEITSCEQNSVMFNNDIKYILTRFTDKNTQQEFAHAYTYMGDYQYSLYYIIGDGWFTASNIVFDAEGVFISLNNQGGGAAGHGNTIMFIVVLVILVGLGIIAWKKKGSIKKYLSKDRIKNITSQNKKNQEAVALDDTNVIFGAVGNKVSAESVDETVIATAPESEDGTVIATGTEPEDGTVIATAPEPEDGMVIATGTESEDKTVMATGTEPEDKTVIATGAKTEDDGETVRADIMN